MAKRKSIATDGIEVSLKRNRRNVSEQSDSSDKEIDENKTQNSQNGSRNDSLHSLERSGKVLGVRLKNFMCHRNLTVDFNRRVNMLVGQNGSGKSAILTALIVGLGSKATATHRSTSIKQLVRVGESSASIEVHLSNDGVDCYEPETYGNRIIVIRTITASGGSTYKLKSAKGHVISQSRADLLKILLYMNIQAENPVCVMTQDDSRGFLRDSDSKKRYELFMKATQLDVIMEKLYGCTEHINNAKLKLKAQRKTHEALAITAQKAEEKLKQFRSMEPLKQEIQRYKCEQQWLAVHNQEQLVLEISGLIDETKAKRAGLEDKLNKIDDTHRGLTEQLSTLNTNGDELTKTLQEGRTKLSEAKANQKKQLEQLNRVKRNVERVENKRSNIQTNITELENHISQESSKNKQDLEELKETNKQKLEDLHTKQADLEATIKSHKRELEVFTSAKMKYLHEKNDVENNIRQRTDEKRQIEMRIKSLHASPAENLKLFGDDMPALLSQLDAEFKQGNFTKKPIGPIANHVEVKHPKYRRFVEDALGKLLLSFCVDNQKDATTFRRILKNRFSRMNITVITSKFQDGPYNIEGRCVKPDHKTARLIDVIVVDSPVVMNCLIDQVGIETILFAEDFDHATNITKSKQNVPVNLSRIILLEPYYEIYPAPSFRSYAKTSQRNSHFLRINSADRENAYQRDLMKVQEIITALSNQVKAIQTKLVDNAQLIKQRNQSMSDQESALQMHNLEIQNILAFEYPEEDGLVITHNELEEQKKLLAAAKAEYDKAKQEFNELEKKLGKVDLAVAEIQNDNTRAENRLEKVRQKVDEITEQLSRRNNNVEYFRKKIQIALTGIERLVAEHTSAQEKLDRLEATAKKIGPRGEITHTDEELKSLIRKNEQKINAVNTSKETIEEIERKAEKAASEAEESRELTTELTKSLSTLYQSLKNRLTDAGKLKSYMRTRISTQFTRVMSLRDCHGTLHFDETHKTLDIEVVPRDKECDNAVSKTTNLSGGERSYTTVAFLLSLWSCIDHPFYFLDEYDVFTDQVNRMYMTRMLLNEANKKLFQFLTPQDISDVTASKNLSILKLSNPDR